MNERNAKNWAKHATLNFQNRSGYPASNVPDMIEFWGDEVEIRFKNTTEETAEKWTNNFIEKNLLSGKVVAVVQEGDYQDDWVVAVVR